MKKRIISCLSLSALMAIGLSAVLLNVSKEAEKTEGYSTPSLPTTIDLNDTSANDIREYYSALDDLAVNERKGNNLLKNLKEILKKDQKYYAYDGTSEGRKIWQIYEISDRDWLKSPASEISGYNADTNKITGYTYGTSYSTPGTNPYLHSLYVDRDVENLMRAWKKDNDTEQRNNHGQNAEWYIDREHIWPKSQGFEASGNGGARGDPMHLWSGDSDVNSDAHNNNFYGYVDTSISYSKGKWSYAKKNYSGTSLTLGTGDAVFEPQDCDKGDIARAIFYMVARYNYLSGEDEVGIDTNNPNLALEQANTIRSSYTSSTSVQGKMGILTDLLAWHKADPVDEWEIHRNNLLYNNYTNNRNPFIDFPEWVDYIWGTATYDGRNYVSYSSTPTGCATPSSDTINGYNSGGSVSVTGVTVSPTETSISVGEDITLTATVAPENASDQSVTWSSSDTSVATVSEGTVTGVAAGTATITVTTVDGGFTDACEITVAAPGEIKHVTIGKDDYTPGYASAGTSGTITKSVVSTNDLSMNYAGINTEASSGSSYSYTMYVGGNGYIYSTTCPAGYYPSNVVVSFTTGTGTSGKAGINFGSSIISTKQTVTGAVSKGGSCSLSNSDQTKKYWNFSTNSANVQINNIVVTYSIITQAPSSISAVVKNEKTFYVGDTITKSDIKVTTDTGIDVTASASFEDYKFTYSDAASGGALTDKVLTNAVTYDTFSCSLTAQVQRKARVEPETITDSLTYGLIGISGTNYADWTDLSDTSDAVYAGNSAGGNESIQLRSSNSAGIISTASGGKIKSVEVTFSSYCTSGRVLNIYGSDEAYSSAADLYQTGTRGDLLGTITAGKTTSITVTGYYSYIGIRSNSGAIYIDEINIIYYGPDTAANVSHYIMFEDTPNQCNSKTSVVENYFKLLSQQERSLFMTSDDYVISTARERLNAWLANQGKSINYSGSDYVVQGARNVEILFEANITIIIVVIFSTVGVLSLGGYFYFRRKKGSYHA